MHRFSNASRHPGGPLRRSRWQRPWPTPARSRGFIPQSFYIPNPVIVGFTAGIAVIIFVGPWKDFFRLSPAPAGLRFHEKLWSLLQALPSLNAPTTGLALLSLALLTVGPRYLRRIPAPLVGGPAAN